MSKRYFYGDLCKHFFDFHIGSVFFGFQSWFYHRPIHWFYPYCSSKRSKWWRHKSGHVHYLIQTYYIFLLILQSKLVKRLSLMTAFKHDFMIFLDSSFMGHPIGYMSDKCQVFLVNAFGFIASNKRRYPSLRNAINCLELPLLWHAAFQFLINHDHYTQLFNHGC